MRRTREHAPRPSIAEPRPALFAAVGAFVQAVGGRAGIRRISLLGSLATGKAVPKDAEALFTIDADLDLSELARAGRRLKGTAQTINLGADIFLADADERYLGRICDYRECHPRIACSARHCGRRDHLNDDLDVVTLAPELIAAPPVELWPRVVRRVALPDDVETLLLAELEAQES
jgi:hypothetical protein